MDGRCVHGEESSVAFSRSIGVELDSEGSIVSTCTEHLKDLNFEDIYHLSASDIIFPYQFAQARPHNVLHFYMLLSSLIPPFPPGMKFTARSVSSSPKTPPESPMHEAGSFSLCVLAALPQAII